MKRILTMIISIALVLSIMTVTVMADEEIIGTIDSVKFNRGEITIDTQKLADMMEEMNLYMLESLYSGMGMSLDDKLDQEMVDMLNELYGDLPGFSITTDDTFRDAILKTGIIMFIEMEMISSEDAAAIDNFNKYMALEMSVSEDFSDIYQPGDTIKELLDKYMEKNNISITGFNKDFGEYFLEAYGINKTFTITELLSSSSVFKGELYYGMDSYYESIFGDVDFGDIEIGDEVEDWEFNAFNVSPYSDTSSADVSFDNLKAGDEIPLEEGLNILVLWSGDEEYPDRSYTFFINALPSSEKDILSFSAAGKQGAIDQTAKTIKAEVPYGTDLKTLKPEITVSDGASVSPNSGEAVDFTKPVEYTVTAEDGSTSKYMVTITVTAKETNPKTSGCTTVYGSLFFLIGAASVGGVLKIRRKMKT